MPDTRKNAATEPVTPIDDPWLTVPTASRQLGVALATVRSLAARRELHSQVVAGRLFIHRDSIVEYLRRRQTAAAAAR